MAEEQTEQDAGAVDLSGIGSFDFTPDWAKGKPDDKSRYARFEPREERDDRSARGRDGGRRDAGRGRPAFGERQDAGRGRPSLRTRTTGFLVAATALTSSFWLADKLRSSMLPGVSQ